jgi:hypothetical protein
LQTSSVRVCRLLAGYWQAIRGKKKKWSGKKKTVYRFPLEMQNKMQKTQNIHEFDIREIRDM